MVLTRDCPCHQLVASCRETQILRISQSAAFSYWNRETEPQGLEARPTLG